MRIWRNLRLGVLVAVTILSTTISYVRGGHPLPPHRHSAEYRQANMLMLRFQDALAAERWQEVLSFCSGRVRAKAAEWPSPGAFFSDTIPIENLLAQDFGCWRCGSTSFGLLVPLSEPGSEPFIQWYWAIIATSNTWVVDYPPVRLDEYIAKKRMTIKEKADRINRIRQSLEPKTRGINTRLIAVSKQFIIGSPMLFRVELTNLGSTPVHYMDSGVAFAPLTVLNDKKRPLSHVDLPSQIPIHQGELVPGGSVVLADKIDLNRHYAMTQPGDYFVQFSGAGLTIGEPLPSEEPGLFGENEIINSFGFLSATNRFPSSVIKIKVTDGRRQ